MRRARFLRIARDGWPFLGLTALVGCILAVTLSPWWALPFLLLACVLAAFFHDQMRSVPPGSFTVTAPVDGEVVHRRECYDPFLDRQAIRLTLEVTLFGVYLVRAPVAGTVRELPPSACSEFAVPVSWFRTKDGHDVVMAVSEGALFGAQPCQAPFGERVGQGRPCGQRRLAQRLDIYLPATCRIEVIQGDTVRAGADVIARFVRKHKDQDDAPHNPIL